jgi:uncharacterized protein (DUF58 family)
MRSKALTLVLIIFGLLLSALLSHQGDLAWMALPFLAYLGLGILKAPEAGKIRLHAVRVVETHREQGKASVVVNVTVTNQGVTLDRLCLSDSLQPGMRVVEGTLRQPALLEPGEATTFQYTFQAERGNFKWETLSVEVADPLGAIETALEVPAAEAVQVPPELKRIRPFPLRTHRTLPSAGSIAARRGGSGTNFWGIREYHPGDPLRRLDWRLTARHPRQFFTKEFEQEALADIGLIVDARGRTNVRRDDDCLFEHSARAAASLAESFLRQGNRVSLLIWGEPMISVFPGYGKVQLNRILRALAQTSTVSDGSLDDLQFVPTQMFSSHSLIVVLSPLAPNDWHLFPRLRGYGYQVLLICPDPFDYAQAGLPTDQITRMASRFARLERQLEISRVTRLWIPVVDWRVSQPLSPLVRQALRQAHIQLKH